MDPSALSALLCPVCGLALSAAQPAHVRCPSGHAFDVARQGYVNLLTGAGTKFAQDTAAMVAARDDFLDAGHYQPLARALATTVGTLLPTRAAGARPLLLDAGTGTGYYLQEVLAGMDAASLGLDISKFALRRAARRNPGTVNLVWDLWRPLPVAAASVDVVLVVFAPRNAAEFARVLKPGGALLVVTPGPGHLAEIAEAAGMLAIQPEKEEALTTALAGHFVLSQHHAVRLPLSLSREEVRQVALMGPAGHHLDPETMASRVAALPVTSPATADFRLSVFTPRS